jgi:hypothetical protein
MPRSIRKPEENVAVRGREAVTVISMTMQIEKEMYHSAQRITAIVGLRLAVVVEPIHSQRRVAAVA